MMAGTKKNQQRYPAGERGRNRVWTFPDPKTGIFQIEWRENGRRKTRSLKHRDFGRAKKQADEFAADYVAPKPESEPEPLTLGRLFEMYLDEVMPKNTERHQRYDRVASAMFTACFGAVRVVSTLNLRDWERFVRDRSSGRIGADKKPWAPVAARTVQKDLSFLRGVLRWATMAGDGCGSVLLERDPLAGLKLPREKNKRRPTLSEEEYQALLRVAPGIDWRFHVALVLGHETGHRIGSINKLVWADVDMERGVIQWRAENEKTGRAHQTPMTEAAKEALDIARRKSPGIGSVPVLPAPKDTSVPVRRDVLQNWWLKGEKLAGLERIKGRGWHSLRRKFATDLMHKPLKVVCELGGWADFKTVVECYQHADEGELREALADRRRAAGSTE
jgi:integrase